MKKIRKIVSEKFNKLIYAMSIQKMLSYTFTTIGVVGMIIIGVLLFRKFEESTKEIIIENNSQVVDQAGLSMDSYIRKMMQISNSMYYTVIKDKDLSNESLEKEMNLLYEANKDSLVSIVCFDEEGKVISAAPVSSVKSNSDVANQDWFIKANTVIENFHFSTPHVQNIFQDIKNRYYWVISLSTSVELTNNGKISKGILLVDMNFSWIEKIFEKANSNGESYMYLIDNNGEIIYHPKQKLIYSNLYEENNLIAATYEEGVHEEVYNDNERVVIVKAVGYTGWKIVSVTPASEFKTSTKELSEFFILILAFMLIVLVLVNFLVSSRIARPISKLDASVKGLENGDLDLDIYVGGSKEIHHLGLTIINVVNKIKQLMDEVVIEQESKRKTELDALQAQINPHFLYNTLDSVIWMVESGRYEDATSMVTSLARLFRLSLNRGKNLISIKDELYHAENYLNIQMVRYKNKFQVFTEIDENILQYTTIKLVLQPIIENAIYHGAEYMMGEAEITIRAYEKNNDIYIEIEDNGMGIPEDTIPLLLQEGNKVRKKGTGIGLVNVHKRIQLYFGANYGVEIESELDEGTIIRIHIPKILFSEDIDTNPRKE